MFAALHHHLPCGQEKGRSFQMQKLSRIAIAAGLLMCPPAGTLLAQTTPSTDTPAATTTAPAATPAPAPTAQPATEAPAAQPATTPPAAATTTPPPAATTTTTEKDAGTKKKKSGKKMTRQQEIDRSIDSGTVPSRYRSQVPKEYQQYVPFSK
jgi:hypothetical protein